jgi:hypothetical protein
MKTGRMLSHHVICEAESSKVYDSGERHRCLSDKKDGESTLIPQAVREALDSVVAPSVRDALLSDALSQSSDAELPTDPEQLRHFVDGPLKTSLIRTLGSELGESVMQELERLAKLVSSIPGERRTRSGNLRSVMGPQRRATPTHRSPALLRRSVTPRPVTQRAMSRTASTMPPPNRLGKAHERDSKAHENVRMVAAHASTIPANRGRAESSSPVSADYPRGTAATFGVPGTYASEAPERRLPCVLVATLDGDLVKKLAAWLDPRAAVVRVKNAGSLLQDLENARHGRSVIVLDCSKPSLRPVALAALADDFPVNTEIVLWGATIEIEEQLRLVLSPGRRWISVGSSAQPKDVATRCAELVC